MNKQQAKQIIWDRCQHNKDTEEALKFLVNSADSCNTVIKALEQGPCETIKEIPKDYKYDTETEDFLVYRHMYTGHEIHIEKPVPRYRLEQQPCEDCISRQAVLDRINKLIEVEKKQGTNDWGYGRERVNAYETMLHMVENEYLYPSVKPEIKPGKWIEGKKTPGYIKWNCSECGLLVRNTQKPWYEYCPKCGAYMREVDG